jgi:hypothetical protein
MIVGLVGDEQDRGAGFHHPTILRLGLAARHDHVDQVSMLNVTTTLSPSVASIVAAMNDYLAATKESPPMRRG